MVDQDHEVLKGLREITEEMRNIVAGVENPYDFGYRIWETSFRLAENSRDLMWPMMLLWSALTDGMDEMKQEEKADAEAVMARAAHAWLTLETNMSSMEAYFNHWLYEEVGYARSSD